MEIKIAPACGFCYGVKRAVQIAIDATGNKEKNYTLGPIIHNPQVVESLRLKGVSPIDRLADIDGGTVIIRSHGVGPECYKEAESRQLPLVDATCPHVKKAQQDAKNVVESGYQLVILGEKEHPEVISISQWADNRAIIIETETEADQLPFFDKLGVVVQTTFSQEKLKKIAEILKSKTHHFELHPTICNATKERQDAAIVLARQVDVMIVIGGNNSGNTRRLAEVCREQQCQVHHIETASELESDWFDSVKKVGITAGASTPDWIIQEVVETMENENVEKTETMSEELINQFDFENDLKKGDIVTGTVVSVNDDAAFISIGTKAEAILPVKEMAVPTPVSAKDMVKVGDELTVEIANNIKEDGAIVVSLVRMKKAEDWELVRKAFESKAIIECTGKEANKAGIVVTIHSLRGFIPLSQGDVKFVKSLENLVGEKLYARIIDLDEKKNRLVLSRKSVLEEERNNKMEEVYKNIVEGSILEGTISKIMPYGAFIDLGGVDGLLHISDISWKKISAVESVLSAGQVVRVLVQKFDQETKRISLSLKALQQDPWEVAIEAYKIGDIVEAQVKKVLPFGAVMAINEDLQGLLHVSELSKQRNVNVQDLLQIGDKKEVKIINIDKNKKKISFSILAITQENEQKEVDQYLKSNDNAGEKETIGEIIENNNAE